MRELLEAALAIDPVLIQLGPIAIRWYALAYVAGILLGFQYIKSLNKQSAPGIFSEKGLDDLVFYAVVGIIIGGRLGYVLFYNAPYYVENPAEIVAIWQGGMSFHGGLIGATVAFYRFSKRHYVPFLSVMDYIACAAPIGLFFGRIANFINGELYGRVSDVNWAVVFPNGGSMPRHPSQLYEALLEGALLFIIMALLWHRTALRRKRGCMAGIFLVGYGLSRFAIEFFREPDPQLGFLFAGATMGQLLCIPMILLGSWLIIKAEVPHESRIAD